MSPLPTEVVRRALRVILDCRFSKTPAGPKMIANMPRSNAKTTKPAMRSFTCPAGSRNYLIHIPKSMPHGPQGLIVMLHGCKQNAADFALGTGMNTHADRHGLIVIYPEQPRSQNAGNCWNWFRPDHQARDHGEPAIIAGLTRRIAARHKVPQGRIYLAGFSAGASMAMVLRDAYPDLYAAVGVHSGLATRSATTGLGALSAMRGFFSPSRSTDAPVPFRHSVPTIVFHGSSDRTVHPVNAARIGDIDRLRRGKWPRRTVVRLVEGGGHGWFGGSPAGSYTDPDGPDASAELIRFFLASQSPIRRLRDWLFGRAHALEALVGRIDTGRLSAWRAGGRAWLAQLPARLKWLGPRNGLWGWLSARRR